MLFFVVIVFSFWCFAPVKRLPEKIISEIICVDQGVNLHLTYKHVSKVCSAVFIGSGNCHVSGDHSGDAGHAFVTSRIDCCTTNILYNRSRTFDSMSVVSWCVLEVSQFMCYINSRLTDWLNVSFHSKQPTLRSYEVTQRWSEIEISTNPISWKCTIWLLVGLHDYQHVLDSQSFSFVIQVFKANVGTVTTSNKSIIKAARFPYRHIPGINSSAHCVALCHCLADPCVVSIAERHAHRLIVSSSMNILDPRPFIFLPKMHLCMRTKDLAPYGDVCLQWTRINAIQSAVFFYSTKQRAAVHLSGMGIPRSVAFRYVSVH